MTKKEIVEGFNTYIEMNESTKAKELDKKDLDRRTMWGIIIFLIGYSIMTTLTLLLHLFEKYLD